jgi:hypothetical protein
MKKLLLLCFLPILFFGCELSKKKSSNNQLSEKQEQIMLEANRQVGMPAIKNYQERKLMKQILELRDQENLICYCYIVPEMTGKPVFLCKCIGYGLPYSTQYTNPQVLMTPGYSERGCTTLPQADPNGLFMPVNAEGTWVMLIDSKTNEPHPVYIETRVLISPFKLGE